MALLHGSCLCLLSLSRSLRAKAGVAAPDWPWAILAFDWTIEAGLRGRISPLVGGGVSRRAVPEEEGALKQPLLLTVWRYTG